MSGLYQPPRGTWDDHPCPYCGQDVRSTGIGRPRSYCSATCRARAFRLRLAVVALARRIGRFPELRTGLVDLFIREASAADQMQGYGTPGQRSLARPIEHASSGDRKAPS